MRFRYAVRSLAIACAAAAPSICAGQGLILSSAGPVNRGMAGASVAAPVDSIGAIYWNPATISGLQSDEMAFGVDVLFADHTISSSFGPFSGETDGEAGTVPIPNVGWVYHTGIPEVTLGLGVNAVAGFKTNLPADSSNPALLPQPLGLGQVSSEAVFLQLAPVVSVAMTERLSVAAGPTITAGQVELTPFVFDPPNASGTYPSGRSTNYSWGGGFQVGTYYLLNEAWSLGSSFKSPNWMDEFDYYSQDSTGGQRTLKANIDLPMIVSTGLAYSGWEDWLLAADFRYLDYANTDGLGENAGFSPAGELTGLGWRSVFATALGAQRRINDLLTVRAGYAYNQNPIDNGDEAFFNIGSPLIYEHTVGGGLSLTPCREVSFNFAASYLLENSRTGQLVSPTFGRIPGSTFTNTMDAYFGSFGITMRR